MKINISLFLLVLTYSSIGQTVPKYIFFYKPYTDSSETNLYKDTALKFDYKTQYLNLQSADVNEDVERALNNNDLRVISISGYSYLFPGLEGGYKKLQDGSKTFIHLDQKYEAHLKKYGFKVIQGTSDHINPDNSPLQSVASDYAKKYNKLLFTKISH